MTVDHWLTAALVLSSLLGPCLAPFIQFRIIQHKQERQPMRPQAQARNEHGLLHRYGLAALLVLCIAGNTYALVSEVCKAGPITRESILQISVFVAFIFLNVLSLGVIYTLEHIAIPVMDQQGEVIKTVGKVLNFMENHEDRIFELESAKFDNATKEPLKRPKDSITRHTDG